MAQPQLAKRRVHISTEQIRRLMRDPFLIVAILAIALGTLTFILYPLLKVVLLPNLNHWRNFFSRARFLTVTKNTFRMVFLSTISATTLGYIFAYATTRIKNMPLARLFHWIGILPLISPPFVIGLSFILLFGRRGLITYSLLGLNFDLYGWHGLWFAQTIAFFPVAYMALAGVLNKINPALEQAAQDLGAKGFTLFRTVTLPLTLPGVAAAALLVANFVLADFGNPMLIGGDFSVLATEAYMLITGRYDTNMAAVLVSVLFLPSLAFFLLQRWVLDRKSFVTVTGKPSSMDHTSVSRPTKWIIFTICALVGILVLSIYVVVFLGAFTELWGVNWNFTLANFDYTIFRGQELWNSVRFAAMAAVITASFSTLGSYILFRKRFVGRSFLEFLSLLPAALPGTMMGIGYVLAFNQKPLILSGTTAIIVLLMGIRNIPFGYRTGVSTLQQIDKSIEEASEDLGAGSGRTFYYVVLPLFKYAFTTTLIYTFIKSINTLSAVIFVVSPGKNVAASSILGLSEHGYWGQASALSAGLIIITFLALGLFRLIARSNAKLFDV